jgi:hypothetical protein
MAVKNYSCEYYTGTEFMREQYRKRASLFLKTVVIPYLQDMKQLMAVA